MPRGTNGDGRVDLQDLNNVRNNFGGIGLGDAVFALLARSDTKLNSPRKAALGRTGAAV